MNGNSNPPFAAERLAMVETQLRRRDIRDERVLEAMTKVPRHEFVAQQNWQNSELEVQMLYGIQRGEQERLARDGCRSVVLVAYGTYWYPWFVRRLAERPANLWFMLRNVFAS